METHKLIIERARASYAAVYLLSAEEQRSLGEIKKAAVELKRNLFVWTVGKGLVHEFNPEAKDTRPKGSGRSQQTARTEAPPLLPDTESPQEVITKIAALPEGSIFVLKLFHHFIEDPVVQAWMMDLMPKFKLSKRMVVILTPVLKIPAELEKDMTLVELALPTKAELGPVLDGIIDHLEDTALHPSEEKRNALLEAAKGLTTTEAENAFTLSIIRPRIIKPNDVENIWDTKIVMSEKCQALKKTGILEYIPSGIGGLSAVGGMDNLKTFVRKRRRAFSEEARAFGLPPPKGILIIGPPGTGKSLGAKAISAELDLPLLKLDMGRIYGGLVGQSEGNIRMAIAIAEALSPCVLWIDEIEKGMAGGSGSLDSGVSQRVLGSLLTWMQEKTAPVFVYATANKPNLPPELVRKGRFDEMFSVDLPGDTERLDIFRIHMGRKKIENLIATDEDAVCLMKHSADFTGAEIEAAVIEAMYTAFDETRPVAFMDIVNELDDTKPQSLVMSEQIRAIREWCASNTRPANRVEQSATMNSGRKITA